MTAEIVGYDGTFLTVKPDMSIDRELLRKGPQTVEMRINDGRYISAEQRKKIFAVIRDISLWSGHEPEYIRAYLTFDFCAQSGAEPFSLSDVDVTTAKEFINYLIEFCFKWNISTRDTMLNCTDDIDRYLYTCLEHRKCAICNKPAEVHHVDRVGMGRDREEIVHAGLRAIALCREHHDAAHRDEKRLFSLFHIHGIKLDEYLCKKLKMRAKKQK